MALLHTKFEEEQKEVCIISLDQLRLEDDEEVKAQDDDGEDDDADSINLQEELLDEVSVLPYDGVSKETHELVQKALHSAEITKCLSKLTPAS